MFSDKLTDALLQICETKRLSYEAAAELCDISHRYFGDVIRKESSPTIAVLEKFCRAFDKAPNELLGYPHSNDLRFRIPISEFACAIQRSGVKDNVITRTYPYTLLLILLPPVNSCCRSILQKASEHIIYMKAAKEPYNDECRNSIYRSEKCRALLNRDDVSDLYALFQMGRSFGGARLKVMTDETVMAFSRASDAEQDTMRPHEDAQSPRLHPAPHFEIDRIIRFAHQTRFKQYKARALSQAG